MAWWPSSPLVMAGTSSIQLTSLSYRQFYTHTISNSSSKHQLFSRRFFADTYSFSSSRIIPINFNRCVRSNLNFPLISPDDHWGTWTALFATGAFGLWSERRKIGRMISGAVVSILLGLACSNTGIIPHEARAYSVVMEFLLPLTIPLMLFRADMRNLIKSTGWPF